MDLMDYRRKIIANSPHLKSASGVVATFSDGADNLPLKSLVVDINPVQSGAGDPSPSNIRPISGWNGVNLTRCGKNLCEPTETVYKNENGSWFNGTDIASVKSALNSLPVGVYTISFKFSVLTTVSGATSWGILIHNTVSGYIDGRQTAQHNSGETLTFAKTLTITESNQGKFDHVYMYSGGGNHADVYWYDFQLELGSTATPYEPYNGVNVLVDLGRTVYGGTLNPLTGVLTVTHISDIQKLSAYNVVSTGTNTVHYRLFDSAFNTSLPKNQDSGNFSNVAKNVYNSGDTTHFYPNISNGRIELWLPIGTNTNTDVQIVCELATPFEIQLTPQQIRTLYGNNTIFADTGNVALEYWAHQ